MWTCTAMEHQIEGNNTITYRHKQWHAICKWAMCNEELHGFGLTHCRVVVVHISGLVKNSSPHWIWHWIAANGMADGGTPGAPDSLYVLCSQHSTSKLGLQKVSDIQKIDNKWHHQHNRPWVTSDWGKIEILQPSHFCSDHGVHHTRLIMLEYVLHNSHKHLLLPNYLNKTWACSLATCACSGRWWATPGSGRIFQYSWPMDEPLWTLSEHFWPSLTISKLYQPSTSFCDHLSTSDHHRKFPQLFATCMRATSYVAQYIPTISDPFIIEVLIILLFRHSPS